MKKPNSTPQPRTDSLVRRDLLKFSALGAASFFIHGCSNLTSKKLYTKTKSPNERLNIAVIGCGGMGYADLEPVAHAEQVVALCDVDTAMAQDAFNLVPKARRYFDYREMLEAEKDLDAVVISTPDHTHAVAAAMAMRMGKHVRVQKPLTHTVEEARLLADLERETGVITQMGNQGTAIDGFRRGAAMLRAGVIGTVKTIHVWTNRPIWPQGMPRPTGVQPIPETLRWDLFLGAAPYRPYHESYQPFSWRGWWDFGTGALGDMACHIMNLAFYALELGAPESVKCEMQEGNNEESAPVTSKIVYRFPANGKRPAVDLIWYDGKMKPPADLLPPGVNMREGGSILVGTEGTMFVDDDYGSVQHIYPEAKFKDYKFDESTVMLAPHMTDPEGKERQTWNITAEWLAAIRGNGTTSSGFAAYSGPFTEAVLLGNVAMRVGKELRWDAKTLTAKGLPEADRFLRKQYSRGFSVHAPKA